MRLKVKQASNEDVYRDIVRISERYRVDSRQRTIRSGTICKIENGKSYCYAIARGVVSADEDLPLIYLDEKLRDSLSVKLDQELELKLIKAGIFGQLMWCWGASDPAYRVVARISVISLFLGVVGLILGVIA